MSAPAGLRVELQECSHPPLPRRVARGFMFMAKGGWKDRIGGPSSFVGFKEKDANLEKLDELASAAGRSRSALIREAISRYLDESEEAA